MRSQVVVYEVGRVLTAGHIGSATHASPRDNEVGRDRKVLSASLAALPLAVNETVVPKNT